MLHQLLKIFGKPKNKGLIFKSEGLLSLHVANYLRKITLSGQFNGIWFKVVNEGKRGYMDADYMRSIGMVAGVSDFVIATRKAVIMVELKVGRNGLEDSQLIFMQWCAHAGIDYYVVKSVKELENIMKKKGMLL